MRQNASVWVSRSLVALMGLLLVAGQSLAEQAPEQAPGESGQGEERTKKVRERPKAPAIVFDESLQIHVLDTLRYRVEFAPSRMVYIPKQKEAPGKPFVMTFTGIYQGGGTPLPR